MVPVCCKITLLNLVNGKGVSRLEDATWKDFVPVAKSQTIDANQFKKCVVNNEPILIIRTHDALYAVSDICTHAYSELSDGELEGERLYCSLHYACFDIRTGKVLEGPTDQPLKTFEITEFDGQIWVRL